MEALLYQLLNSETETEILEFKKAERQFDKDKLGKYFSALSNEANLAGKQEAWLLMGITNDKCIAGTQISDQQINEYKREVANNTSPTLGFINVHRVVLSQGDVLMFQIPAAPKGMPVAWKNLFYARDGESLCGLNINKIERIRVQNTKQDWSAQIIKDATVSDLSPDAIATARKQFAEKNPKLKEIIETWDDITFLNKAKVCINGQITNTAILLLGKAESEHFISPAVSKISWILKDRDNIEKDYAHFTCPLLLQVDEVYRKIRNLKYRYLISGTLFPDEVDQFEPYIIREAINNCIAHQDYSLCGKINLVEREDGILTFINSGSFIPESIEKVIVADAPETEYRNPFLANAMVSLNMIDTIGSGIRKMFVIQKNKYFPLPEYDFSNNKVKVQIIGKVVDENYARKLAKSDNLSLEDIILLDKVAKHKTLTDNEIKTLKGKKLIEGRKPNFYISLDVAKLTGEKEDYIKLKGFNEDYYADLITKYLKKFKKATRSDIKELLFDKLPDILSEKQKDDKIKNLLQKMKGQSTIKLDETRKWILDEF